MKRSLFILMVLAMSLTLVIGLASCGSKEDTNTSSEEQEETADDAGKESDGSGSGKADGSESIVIFFSLADNADLPKDVDASSSASIIKKDGKVIGNAEQMALWIQEELGADSFMIKTKDKYPGNYDETVELAKKEQSANKRPELAEKAEDLDKYKDIYLVYPNWWYDLPMPVYSFLESHDLAGKKIYCVATHGGSGFSDTVDAVKKLQPKAEVIQGVDVYYSDVEGAEKEVKDWVKSL